MGAKERKDAANEVKVLSSLKHPYIVAYKDSFIEDGFLNSHGVRRWWGPLHESPEGAQVDDEVPGADDPALVHPGAACTQVHPRQAHPAPGPEVPELLPDVERQAEDRRLRHRQGAGQHGCLRADDDRNAVLPEPGDLPGAAVLLGERHVVARLRALRVL